MSKENLLKTTALDTKSIDIKSNSSEATVGGYFQVRQGCAIAHWGMEIRRG